MKTDKDEHDAPVRYCRKCGFELVVEDTLISKYPFYCPNCDENMFAFETFTTEDREKNDER